ncbi:MAG: SLC13 family permease [Porticoccaceae bacterium]|nr:SLC13 family permease [Porticoccaceae bacterium]
MSSEALTTLMIIAGFLCVVVSGRIAVDIALAAVMAILLVFGVLSPVEALQGFSNPALFIIACFYIVSSAIKESGALHWWVMKWLGSKSSASQAMPRIMLPVALMSSVISNTPVVAIFIPLLQDWARRHDMVISKLLIPLSFASILGGVCTLVGTSTNILVVGLLESTSPAHGLNLFSPAVIGLPLVGLGVAYFMLLGHRLLPQNNAEGMSQPALDIREYAVNMRVEVGGPMSGKTIAEAGLRHLKYGFLAEIQSEGRVIPAVGPEELLSDNDVLVFVGQPESVGELRQLPGLQTAEKELLKLEVPNNSRALVEAIVAPASTLVGKTIKASGFRSRFDCVVVSVSRNGLRINEKVGSITLRGGDTLLIEAAQQFAARYRYSRDFLLLSRIDDLTIPDTTKAPVTLGLLGLFLMMVVSGLMPLVSAAMLLVVALGVCGCISLDSAQRSVDARVLLAIGASLSIGVAIQTTGLAESAALGLMSIGGENPYLNLLLLYMATVIATELITNNAAAIIMFPLAQVISAQLDASLLPFALAIMFGASASFLSPVGYQTNLMVQGPGGYQFRDYFKVGIGLSILVGLTVVFAIPLVWPF